MALLLLRQLPHGGEAPDAKDVTNARRDDRAKWPRALSPRRHGRARLIAIVLPLHHVAIVLIRRRKRTRTVWWAAAATATTATGGTARPRLSLHH
jgi:hypothetical protein